MVLSLGMNIFIFEKDDPSSDSTESHAATTVGGASVEEEDSVSLIETYFDRSTLDNKDFSNYKSWVHVFMVFVHTFLTIHLV